MESLLRFPFWTSTFCLYLSWTQVQAATFVVNVTQSSYQAEENHNITLEWTFTSRPNRTRTIYCCVLTLPREIILYSVYEDVEETEFTDEHFKGRVQMDKDVLREGRIRFHLSRLRTEDSGLYLCYIRTDYGRGSAVSNVTITETVPQRTSPTPEEETIRTGQRSRLLLCLPAAVFFFFFLVGFLCYFRKFPKNNKFCPLHQIYVHADRNSAERDSNQQLYPPGEDLHPLPQSDSGQSALQMLI
ncbi:PREDICTED: uncharacterized protein LOC107096138 [Cyprinodon variegatus]|uniref:uncharacterized protein LOC107096138 n=1 Tax=Cyprinodon variegatus TaxID=28743 RepID=UPI000742A527|nr:PREDICTED: uncharacterized protein LOC107096138 [Cyprinodon variegatus]